MVGTRGVPARYGGFESAVEEIGWRLAERGHEVIVYCRNEGQTITEYRGMQLVNLPALRLRSTETLTHGALSATHAVLKAKPDMAFVFNAANAPFVSGLRRGGVPTAVNIDGFESKRAKWEGMGAKYYQWAERASVLRTDAIIADSRVMQAHVLAAYGREAHYIPYGAPIAHPGDDLLAAAGLQAAGYHLIVARFEPENQVRELVQGYVASAATAPLVVVGAAPYAEAYTQSVRAAAGDDPRVRFLGAVWDQVLLDQLYAGCLTYLHGHSVGGTNPSLLRAMGAAAPVVADDNPFNREVAGRGAEFITQAGDLAPHLAAAESDPAAARVRGHLGQEWVAQHYRWDEVVDKYEALSTHLGDLARR